VTSAMSTPGVMMTTAETTRNGTTCMLGSYEPDYGTSTC
jgi:hypothetical protein